MIPVRRSLTRTLVAIGLLSAGIAQAQAPSLGGGSPLQLAPGGAPISFEIPGAPKGPLRYATEAVTSIRFLGEQVPGPALATGDAVEVIVEEGGWVRVRKGESYGWVEAAKLSEQAPAPAASPDVETGAAALPGLAP